MKNILGFIACLVWTAQSWPSSSPPSDPGGWIYRVDVQRLDGTTDLGSAIFIAPERVLTNCHVIHNAAHILLTQGDKQWTARLEKGDSYRDLCLLAVAGLDGRKPILAWPDDYRVGDPVVAMGYSSGQFSEHRGVIKGLYRCECDGGQVIQTTAPFEPGASGGGLFDLSGKLIGVLTFKSVSGGDFHFAVPASWSTRLQHAHAGDADPFWKNEAPAGGFFLAACDMAARSDWDALSTFAEEWTRHQPADPESWVALGRAKLGLRQPAAAVVAFERALSLDFSHNGARWELEVLRMDRLSE